MYDIPRLELQLGGLKYHVVHALQARNVEMEKMVADEIERAISSMDWNEEIRRIAMREIKTAVERSVESYFRVGEGRKKVDELVKVSLGG